MTQIIILSGILSISIGFIIIFYIYNKSKDFIIQEIFNENHNLTNSYNRYLNSIDKNEHDKLNELIRIWEKTDSQYSGSYVCVVKDTGKLTVHTKDPKTVGNNVGLNQILSKSPAEPKNLKQLVDSKKSFTGYYISSEGEKQVASFIYNNKIKSLIAIHVPLKEVENQVTKFTYLWIMGFGFLILIIFPTTLFILQRSYHSSQDILKQAYEDIIENENRYKSLVEHLPGIAYRCDADKNWTVHWISEQIEKITGYPNTDFVGNAKRSFTSIIHPEDQNYVDKAVWEGINNKMHYIIEYRVIHKNGSVCWVYERGKGIFDENNELKYLEGVIFDQTHEKQIEQSLKGYQDRLSFLINETPLASVEFDRNSIVLAWNSSAEKIFGYSSQEAIGKSFFDLIIPGYSENHVQLIVEKLFSDRGGAHSINDNLTKSGKIITCEWHNTPIFDANGTLISVISMAQDITSLIQTQTELENTKERLSNIFNTLIEGVTLNEMIFNDQGEMIDYKIIEVNEAFYKVADYICEGSVIGKTATDIYKMDSELIKDFWKYHKNSDQTMKVEMISPLSNRYFEIQTSPFKNNQFITSFHDITDRKIAEETLIETKQKFKQLAENINEVFWLGSPDWKQFYYISPAYEYIWERPVRELYHDPNSWIKSIHPEDMDKVLQVIKNAQENMDTLPMIYFPEYRILTNNDKIKWIHSIGYPVRNENGQVYRIAGVAQDVSDRKLAENALIESKEYLVRLNNTLSDVIFNVKMPERTIEYVNQGVEKLFGYSVNECIGKTTEIFYPNNESYIHMGNLLKKTMDENKDILKIDYELRKKNGSIFHANITTTIYESNNKMKVISVVRDISDRIKAEQALKKSRKRYQSVVDTASDTIIVTNELGVIQFANRSVENIFGYTFQELLNQSINIIIPGYPDFFSENRIVRIDSVTEKHVYWKPIEGNGKHKDGHSIEIELSFGEFNEDNKHLFTTIIRDITERKQSESEILKLSEAVEQSSSSIVITNTDGIIEYINPKFSEITGYSKSECIGQNPKILKSGYTNQETYRKLWEIIKDGKVWQGEFLNKKKNGELYWESTSICPVKNNEGKIINFLAIKEDVTDFKKNQEELTKYRENLERLVEERTDDLQEANAQLKELIEREKELSQMKDEFTSNVNHELRTPLTSIIMTTEYLQEIIENVPPAEMKNELNRIHRSSQSLLKLINELLDFSRIEAGRYMCHLAEINLAYIFSEIKQNFEDLCTKKGIKLSVSDPKDILLHIDSDHLLKIINNLMSNAFKFTDQGFINLSATIQNDHINIQVADSGRGIAQNDLQNIFERFTRSKYEDKYISGTGIGLHMVKKLTENHGGNVSVISEIGKGSTFQIELPKKSLWDNKRLQNE